MKKFTLGLIFLFVNCLFATNAHAHTLQDMKDRADAIATASNNYHTQIRSPMESSVFWSTVRLETDIPSYLEHLDCPEYYSVFDDYQDLLGRLEGANADRITIINYHSYISSEATFWHDTVWGPPTLDPGFFNAYYTVMGNLLSQISGKMTTHGALLASAQQLESDVEDFYDYVKLLTPCDELEGEGDPCSCTVAMLSIQALTLQDMIDRYVAINDARSDYLFQVMLPLDIAIDASEFDLETIAPIRLAHLNCPEYDYIFDEYQYLLGRLEGAKEDQQTGNDYVAYLWNQVVFWSDTIHGPPTLDPGFFDAYYAVMGNLLSQINGRISSDQAFVTSAQELRSDVTDFLGHISTLTPCDELEGEGEGDPCSCTVAMLSISYQDLVARFQDVSQAIADFQLLTDTVFKNTMDSMNTVSAQVISKYESDFDCPNYGAIADEIQELLGEMEGSQQHYSDALDYKAYILAELAFWQGEITPSLDPGYFTPYYNVLGNFLSQLNGKIMALNNQITSAQNTLDHWNQLKAELDVLTPCDELEGDNPE